MESNRITPRQKILNALQLEGRYLTLSEISKALQIALPNISKDVAALEKAGTIKKVTFQVSQKRVHYIGLPTFALPTPPTPPPSKKTTAKPKPKQSNQLSAENNIVEVEQLADNELSSENENDHHSWREIRDIKIPDLIRTLLIHQLTSEYSKWGETKPGSRKRNFEHIRTEIDVVWDFFNLGPKPEKRQNELKHKHEQPQKQTQPQEAK